jgi:hypothetical protein
VPQLLPKWRCLIDMYFGRCDGRLVLDWMCLCEFSSDLCKNWSEGNSLMVRNCLMLSVDGSGAAIVSEVAMFDWCVFWEVWGKARAWLDVSLQVLEQFPRELRWGQLPDGEGSFGVVGGWQRI